MLLNTLECAVESLKDKGNLFYVKAQKALVIEDDYVSYMVIHEALEGIGIKCKRIFSIEPVIRATNLNGRFDVIIINRALSTSQQIEIIKHLKMIFFMPVVVVGEYRQELEWVDCFVSSIFEPATLQDAVQSLV